MLIGCGPHAKRIYLPALWELRQRGLLNLTLVVDLKSQGPGVRDTLGSKWGGGTELLLVDPFRETMPEALDRHLAQFADANAIGGVIIATEPLVHRAYASWALRNGLSILMDKPISARPDSTSKVSSALGILEDYTFLLAQYRALQQRRETVFIVNSQRRFHAGFQFVEQQIKQVAQLTNCPVTFVQSSHSDGQWRLPSEIVTQDYHPYCFGYGKASHSGYHLFDMLYRFYAAAEIDGKTATTMEIVSSFIQPNGFIQQLADKDYLALFGEDYKSVRKWSDGQLQEIFRDYGEIDLSAIVTLKRHDEAIANLSVNLIHNGFACRTWLEPGSDLYKGNGRVKHEHHNIQQGPFQNIQIHSYQATDKHDKEKGLEDTLGGENHFDIYVFRNPLVAGESGNATVYKLDDILSNSQPDGRPMLGMERAKFQVVDEFVDFLLGRREKVTLKSQIDDHIVPVQLMSGVYQSHIHRMNKRDCMVRSDFGFGGAP